MEQMLYMLLGCVCMIFGAGIYASGIKSGRKEAQKNFGEKEKEAQDNAEEKEEAVPESLRRQWENYLAYDGTPQEDVE